MSNPLSAFIRRLNPTRWGGREFTAAGFAVVAVTAVLVLSQSPDDPIAGVDPSGSGSADTRVIAALGDRELGSDDGPAVADRPSFSPDSYEVDAVALAGVWHVTSYDSALQAIEGRAIIAEDEASAIVRFQARDSGEAFVLRSTRFERGGGILRIRFEGEMPGGRRYVGTAAGDVIETADQAVSFSVAGAELELNLARPVRQTQRVVEVALDIGPTSLVGGWTQRWNAPRYFDQPYSGRQGDLRYTSDNTGQVESSQREIWTRLAPRIHAVIPLSRQMQRLEYGLVRFPHPDGQQPGDITVTPSTNRTLLVIGTDLPTELGEPVTLGGDGPGLSYAVEMKQHAFATDFTRRAEIGWDRLRAEVDPQTFERLRGMDAILVRADIDATSLPGTKTLTVNGAEASWVLQFGDFSGRIDFARRLNDSETEATDVLLAPETFVVELAPDRDLKVETIEVVLFRGAEPVLFPRSAIGAETPGAPGDNVRRIPANRESVTRFNPQTGDEEERIVYRTIPLRLQLQGEEDSGPGWPIPVREGETLRASIAEPGVYEPRPRLAQAAIATSVAMIARARRAEHTDRNLTWPAALIQSFECAEVEFDLSAVGDAGDDLTLQERLDRLTQTQVDSFSNLVVLNPTDTLGALSRELTGVTLADLYRPTWFEVGVTAGDHAAMLILRDAFVDLMLEQQAAWRDERLAGDAIDGLRIQLEQTIYQSSQPFSEFEVTAPDGETIPFWRSYDDDPALKRQYGLDDAALHAWRRRATRQAGEAYLAALRLALQSAQAVDACNVSDLLDLTATGFGAAERQAAPRLMRASSAGGWEPDRIARAYLRGHTTLASAIRAQQELSSADTDRLALAAAIGGGLGAAAFGTVSAAWLAFAIDATDFGITTANESVAIWRSEEERAFARGATAVLGAGRYDYANRTADMRWFVGVTKVTLGFAGAADSFVDAWRLTSLTRSVARGHARIANDLTPNLFDRLERSVQDDILNAIEEARRLDAAFTRPGVLRRGRGLTDAERTAYDLGERLRQRYLGRPSWADDLPARTYTQIADMRQRADVARLATESPQRFAALMDDPIAREVLRAPPNATSFEQLVQAIERERRRARTPIGADFYTDMAIGTPDPLGFRFSDGVTSFPGGNRDATVEVYLGQLEVGRARRALSQNEDGTLDLTMVVSELDLDGLTWVGTARRNLLGENSTRPGIPLALYMNARTMQSLGIEFADPRLTTVTMSNITNGVAAVQLQWLRRRYPDLPIDELLRFTHSYRYAETAMSQAGFRITGARLVPKDRPPMTTVENLIGGPGAWYRNSEDWRSFIARHGIEPDDLIEHGFTIKLDVEPF